MCTVSAIVVVLPVGSRGMCWYRYVAHHMIHEDTDFLVCVCVCVGVGVGVGVGVCVCVCVCVCVWCITLCHI